MEICLHICSFQTKVVLQRGTLEYMAPELKGAYSEDPNSPLARHPVTLAVDIYSFGLVLRETVTGERTSLKNPSWKQLR